MRNYEVALMLPELKGFTVINDSAELFDNITGLLDIANKTAEETIAIRNDYVQWFVEYRKDKDVDITRLSYVTAVIDYNLIRKPNGYKYVL